MRSRLVSPEFFTDEDLGRLPAVYRQCFQGLWLMADRLGRLEDRPGRIKLHIFPFDPDPPETVLTALTEAGFILRYEVEGRRYIQVRNFNRFQHPHPKEQPSKIPAPGGNPILLKINNAGELHGKPGNSGTCPSDLSGPSDTQDLRILKPSAPPPGQPRNSTAPSAGRSEERIQRWDEPRPNRIPDVNLGRGTGRHSLEYQTEKERDIGRKLVAEGMSESEIESRIRAHRENPES